MPVAVKETSAIFTAAVTLTQAEPEYTILEPVLRVLGLPWAKPSSSPAITVTWPPWSGRGSSVLPEL